jgi:hypothetical protein
VKPRQKLIAYPLLALCVAILAPAGGAETRTRIADREEILGREFTRQVVRVAENVYVAVGFGAANSALIVGDDGVIIVDTMLCPFRICMRSAAPRIATCRCGYGASTS